MPVWALDVVAVAADTCQESLSVEVEPKPGEDNGTSEACNPAESDYRDWFDQIDLGS
jgi:hypothetical protein